MVIDVLRAIGDVLTSEAAYINALTFAVFLAFGAAGEWVAERSGTLNISLEAMFLAGAFAAAVGADRTDNVLVGVLFAMVAGLVVAWVQANMSHRLVANQFVVGLTLNILVLGVTSFLASELEPVTSKAPAQRIPLLADIPIEERSIPVDVLYRADEVFLTGTTLEVLGVVQIDGNTIGAGQPGPITKTLAARCALLTA